MSGGRRPSPARAWTAVVVGCAVALSLTLANVSGVPLYPAWMVSLSLALFAVYGIDKRRARRGGGRVPEIVLHGVALAGGFPGGWAGRSFFRHKTRRPIFPLVLTVATLVHLALILQFVL